MMMALNKKQLFSPKEVNLADFAGALSHPARIAIVTFLQERGKASCGQIVAALPLAQATVSQHLNILRRGGLVTAEACGASVCYRLDGTRIRHFCEAFQQALGTEPAQQQTDRCVHGQPAATAQ